MNGSADDRGGDYAYIRTKAAPREVYDDEDPYDDGLNPARGMISGIIMGGGLFVIIVYVLYRLATWAYWG
jgi:hypothetical protein